MALCDSHSGSHRLSLPLSGILWPSLAHYCSLISRIQPLIGPQGPCSALITDATMTHFILPWRLPQVIHNQGLSNQCQWVSSVRAGALALVNTSAYLFDTLVTGMGWEGLQWWVLTLMMTLDIPVYFSTVICHISHKVSPMWSNCDSVDDICQTVWCVVICDLFTLPIFSNDNDDWICFAIPNKAPSLSSGMSHRVVMWWAPPSLSDFSS